MPWESTNTTIRRHLRQGLAVRAYRLILTREQFVEAHEALRVDLVLRQHEHSTNHLVRELVRRPNGGRFRTRSNRCLRSRDRNRRANVPGTAARDSVGPSGQAGAGRSCPKAGRTVSAARHLQLPEPTQGFTEHPELFRARIRFLRKRDSSSAKLSTARAARRWARSRPRLRPRAAT